MKRYLVLGKLYDFDLDRGGEEGAIGSVDSLDDISDPNIVGEVVDTTIGKVYEYNGVEWKPSGDVPDDVTTVVDPFERTVEQPVKNRYYVDMKNGSNIDNDGSDRKKPFKTLTAALAISNKAPGRSEIYVRGDQYTEEFRV